MSAPTPSLFTDFDENELRAALIEQTEEIARLVAVANQRGDSFWQHELQLAGDLTLVEAREMAK